MNIFQDAQALLGRSDKDPAVVGYLQSLGIGLPLKRPPRGERGTNMEVPEHPQIELVFTRASALEERIRQVVVSQVFA